MNVLPRIRQPLTHNAAKLLLMLNFNFVETNSSIRRIQGRPGTFGDKKLIVKWNNNNNKKKKKIKSCHFFFKIFDFSSFFSLFGVLSVDRLSKSWPAHPVWSCLVARCHNLGPAHPKDFELVPLCRCSFGTKKFCLAETLQQYPWYPKFCFPQFWI